jgi:hypothetical protein
MGLDTHSPMTTRFFCHGERSTPVGQNAALWPGGMMIALGKLKSGGPSHWRFRKEGCLAMLQMLLSDWIVRFFLLYLIVVGGLVFIRRERQTMSASFVCFPFADIHDRWMALETRRAPWWDKYNQVLRDKHGIRIGLREQSNGKFWRDSGGLNYA